MAKTSRPEVYVTVQAQIGSRIKEVRELRKLTKAGLARALSVDPSTLAKIEDGSRAPSVFNIIQMANRLRVTTDYLLRGQVQGRTEQCVEGRMDEETAFELGKKAGVRQQSQTRTELSTDTDPVSCTPRQTKTLAPTG